VDIMTTTTSRPGPLDGLDGRILGIFAAEPRVGVLECSRRLGVARGTVQARLDRLARDGVIRGWGPELDAAAMGYTVTAFATLEIRQASSDRPGHDAVAAHLATIPQVLEVHTITGAGDMFARIVARSNADLQRVIDLVVDFEGVVRTSTVIALATQIPYRVQPLVRLAGADSPDPADAADRQIRPVEAGGTDRKATTRAKST
jgi:DNA-binding Lrp family transcriptional regulator